MDTTHWLAFIAITLLANAPQLFAFPNLYGGNVIKIDDNRACNLNNESLLIHEKHFGEIVQPSKGQHRTCSWTLLAPPGFRVWVRVKKLIHHGTQCSAKIELYDGHSRKSRLWDSLCSNLWVTDSTHMVSTRNSVYITYDAPDHRGRYTIEYMFLPEIQDCQAKQMLPCKHNNEERTFFKFNQQCYKTHQMCDGVDDCGDGTDEERCRFEDLNLVPESQNCGASHEKVPLRHPRIRNGKPANEGSFPWMASLHNDIGPVDMPFCSAVLISDQWLLTAAHCLDGVSRLSVRLGVHHQHLRNESNQVRYVDLSKDVYLDRHWENGEPEDKKNDIALMKMNAPIATGNPFVTPICLPTPKEPIKPGSKAQIAGWGNGSEFILKMGTVPIVSNEDCSERYGTMMDETVICAGQYRGGDDTCYGDSGGPLMVRDESSNSWRVIGITSLGYDDNIRCEEGPTIYTAVDPFLPWIKETMEKYQ